MKPELKTGIYIPLATVFFSTVVLGISAWQDMQLLDGSKADFSQESSVITETNISASDVNIDVSNEAAMLFGVPVINEITGLERLPETQVALELKGTFASSTSHLASALIAERGTDSQRYFLNENITDEIELVRVEKELVVLRRNNQDEILRLTRFDEIQTGPELRHRNLILSQSDDRETEDENSLKNSLVAQEESAGISTSPPQARLSIQERLARLRERYSDN